MLTPPYHYLTMFLRHFLRFSVFCLTCFVYVGANINPLRPDIHIQILQTADLNAFP